MHTPFLMEDAAGQSRKKKRIFNKIEVGYETKIN
jgi:hypothetical protein